MKSKLYWWCAALLALAYLVPNHYPPWLSFHGELVAAIAFMPLVVWASRGSIPIPAVSLGGYALAVVAVGQVIFGQTYFAGDGWVTALYLSGFALVVLTGYRWAKEEFSTNPQGHGLNMFWCAFLVAGYVSVGIALQQSLSLGSLGIYGAEIPPGARAVGNLAQPNHLATLLLLAVAAHIAIFESGQLAGGVSLLGALFLAVGLVLSGSRSVFLVLLWSLPGYWLMRRRCRLRTQGRAVVAVSLFFVAATLWWPHVSDSLLLPRELSNTVDRLGTPGARTIYWSSMLDAVGRAPWLGYGWAQIGVAQTETALDYPPVHEYFYSSHNLFLDLLLWNGIPIGSIAIAGLVLWSVWQLRQCRDGVSFATIMAIGFVLSHAMIEYPLSYSYFLLPVGFLMGVLSTLHPCAVDTIDLLAARPLRRVTIASSCALAIAVLVKLTLEYPVWETDWRYLQFQEARIGNPEHIELPAPVLLTQLRELMAFARTEPKPDMSAAELESMRRVSGRFGHASGMYRYATALALNERPDEAYLALQRLCRMHSEELCLSAQRDWLGAARHKHPQLARVPFPTIGGVHPQLKREPMS